MWTEFPRGSWTPEENPWPTSWFQPRETWNRGTQLGCGPDLHSFWYGSFYIDHSFWSTELWDNKRILDCFKPLSWGIIYYQNQHLLSAALFSHGVDEHSQGCSHLCWHAQGPSHQPSQSALCMMQPLTSPGGRVSQSAGESIVRSTACHFVLLALDRTSGVHELFCNWL